MTPLATSVLSAATEGDVMDAVRSAHDTGQALRIRGGGTWMDAGRPVAADRILDLSRLQGIVQYEPGDLTLTAWAGTTLAEIAATTSRHGQWLPLDAPARPQATLGATIATASAGPLGATIGLPRDLALGVTFVTGNGRRVMGGGRVVKNVAGFDLVRLTVGAWGTLGVVTQATVRLRARPACDRTVIVVADGDDDVGALIERLVDTPHPTQALALLNAPLAARLRLPPLATALLRVGGNTASVDAQLARVDASRATPADPELWQTLGQAELEGTAVLRLSVRPSDLASLWRAIDGVPGVWLHASVMRGIVRCIAGDAAALDEVLRRAPDHAVRIGERLPWAQWNARSSPTLRHRLAHGVREAFDPKRILNPGILGDTP